MLPFVSRMRSRFFCSVPAGALGLPAARAAGGQKRDMKPQEMVDFLDEHIIGQGDAKKALANALRNRWRRSQLPPELRSEIIPKNILMVGPTGVGKTEIARRLSILVDAPFIKVEATKFTEVGFRGNDVDSIIKDLVEMSMKLQRSRLEEEFKAEAMQDVEDSILVALVGNLSAGADRETWLQHLRSGSLDSRSITVSVPVQPPTSDFSEGTIRVVSQGSERATERKKMTIKEAKSSLLKVSLDKTIDKKMLVSRAIEAVEQDGIVFIDEIDKIANRGGDIFGSDASAEGVQRDLLPIIEGSEVSTRHGTVKTDHILFVCSGAFHSVKPSDLIAELQGRLPVRVHLQPLTEADFLSILTRTKFNLLMQQEHLLRTEGVELVFDPSAVEELAKVACEINRRVENIGARRLHTIVERVMEDISFSAPQLVSAERLKLGIRDASASGGSEVAEEATEADEEASSPVVQIRVDRDLIRQRVSDMMLKGDLQKYVL